MKLVDPAIVVPSEEANAPDQRIESVMNSYRDMSNQRFSLTKLWKRLPARKEGVAADLNDGGILQEASRSQQEKRR
ncbi:MAG: hypothetical protein B6D34_12365 [Candidatus Brocadia sp. UTAMX1]|nr:MAG: hypothetical protein B6D34_12365 [Candidatus Brocadia sp. UTAMX1]